MPLPAAPSVWLPPSDEAILRWPLPGAPAGCHWLLRGLSLIARRKVLAIRGLENIRRDPFILALNHSTRTESVLVPALLFLYRGGRIIHFLADWNFRLIPGVGPIYDRAETITVTRKPARPRLFNLLKPLYRQRLTALERARAQLSAERSVAFFPEGAVNRDPQRLLAGRRGAARLSLETGVPVVPAGIRFPRAGAGELIGDLAAMEVEIGTPLFPPAIASAWAPLADVRAWHAVIMNEISRLAGKRWTSPWENRNGQ
ncbi:MAG TPA: lysophospholipid acyltransferase family protein [Xanthobacteraceae bacterium]|nr:lysophospholipid acyltransferase family protein [Xanthobacteraceae bacterium]